MNIFLCISMDRSKDLLVRGHSGPRDLCLNKLGERSTGRQCYITNFKHLSKAVLKKKVYGFYFMHSNGSNLGPLWRGHLGPCGIEMNKLGKKLLDNAIYGLSEGFLTYSFNHLSLVVLWKKIARPVNVA